MGHTGRLELRRSSDVVQLDDDGNKVLDDNGDAVVLQRAGRWRVLSDHLPERHHIGLDLFLRIMADGQVNGNTIEFDTTADPVSPKVRYRVLPPNPNGPSERSGVYLVLVGSSEDTSEAVGGIGSFDAWRGFVDGVPGADAGVKHVHVDDHVPAAPPRRTRAAAAAASEED